MSIGKRLQEEMNRIGISQNALAKLAKVSQTGISAIIRGQVSPKEDTLRMIADAMQIPVSRLMDDNKEAAADDRDDLKQEFNLIYESLPEQARQDAVRYLRYLASQASSHTE